MALCMIRHGSKHQLRQFDPFASPTSREEASIESPGPAGCFPQVHMLDCSYLFVVEEKMGTLPKLLPPQPVLDSRSSGGLFQYFHISMKGRSL